MITYQPSRAPAYAALALLGLALAAGFLPVLRMGLEQGFTGLDPYVFRVLRFTLLQAGLSTLLSLALGLPLARALARHSPLDARQIAEEAMKIAADICIYTNANLTIEEL